MSDNTETLNAIQTAFNEFKSTNDALVKQVESKGAADIVTAEKLDRIEATLTDLETRAARPAISQADQAEVEYRAEFEAFARKGVEVKATQLTTGTSSGGVALPKQVEAGIYTALTTVSPIRKLAKVISISTSDYRVLVNNGGTGTGWVGETDARPETNAPTMSELKLPMGEIYANPAVSQNALDDLAFNVDQFLVDDISLSFAIKEAEAFVNGDGVNKPKGFLAETGVTTVKTGNASGLGTSADAIIDMVQSMSAAYRAGSAFLSASGTNGSFRKLKAADGNYIWQPSLVVGAPATLFGFPIYEEENIAAASAGTIPLVFANLAQGYVIADRQGISLLRDPYTHKPFVTFYATKRVGGMVKDKKAFVYLKVSV